MNQIKSNNKTIKEWTHRKMFNQIQEGEKWQSLTTIMWPRRNDNDVCIVIFNILISDKWVKKEKRK